ncbi:MAG: hypothetical protein GEU95_25275, partial [Rhizobiales bacterium]|nr:hypothetical protein [Hyphomicrobiales bacterium]
ERIAASLRITPPSLRKHYFSELKYRDVARDRHDAKIGMMLLDQGEAGNVAATKAYLKFVERNDLMLYGQTQQPQRQSSMKEPKLGKKEAAALAAQNPDPETPLGDLMARRQQSLPN